MANGIEAIYPLSSTQEGMLFHSLCAPNSGIYFEQVCFDMYGKLNLENLYTSWSQVIASHAVLRTLFHWEDKKRPLQIVLQQVKIPWEELDWRAYDASKQEELLQAFLDADRRDGFEMSKAPLLRFKIFRMSESKYHFVWSFHHVLMDGWSMVLLLKEVFKRYGSICQGKNWESSTPPPYRSYVTWLQKQNLAEAERFWKEELEGFHTPISLNIANVLPEDQEDQQNFSTYVESLPLQFCLDLGRWTKTNTLMQEVWAILLNYYSKKYPQKLAVVDGSEKSPIKS